MDDEHEICFEEENENEIHPRGKGLKSKYSKGLKDLVKSLL